VVGERRGGGGGGGGGGSLCGRRSVLVNYPALTVCLLWPGASGDLGSLSCGEEAGGPTARNVAWTKCSSETAASVIVRGRPVVGQNSVIKSCCGH